MAEDQNGSDRNRRGRMTYRLSCTGKAAIKRGLGVQQRFVEWLRNSGDSNAQALENKMSYRRNHRQPPTPVVQRLVRPGRFAYDQCR